MTADVRHRQIHNSKKLIRPNRLQILTVAPAGILDHLTAIRNDCCLSIFTGLGKSRVLQKQA